MFGEVVIFFLVNIFFVIIVLKIKIEVIFILKYVIIEMCKKNEKFLYNFLNFFLDRIFFLNIKFKENMFFILR